MFFILSKLLINFIYPTTWIGISLLFALILKNQAAKKRCLLIAFTLFIVFTNPFLLNSFARYWDIDEKTAGQHYSCAIVLGGFISEDKNGNGSFNGASDRFIQALKLKLSGRVDYLLFTGGNASLMPGKFRETAWLSTEMHQFTISNKDVLIEKQARNTLENAKFTKLLLKTKQLPQPYLLVTSAFHMRRSLHTFKKAGLNVVPYSCNYIAGNNRLSFASFIPDVGALSNWNTYIKEVVGFVVYRFK